MILSRTEVGADLSEGRGEESEGREFSIAEGKGEVCFL